MNDFACLEQLCKENNIEFSVREPMSKHTTFRIGGPAELFVKPKNQLQIQQLLQKCSENKISPLFVGRGSNLLVNDAGINGVVISTSYMEKEIAFNEQGDIVCSAGVPLAALCLFALEHSLTGLEFAWGIPGSVGGAVFMNAGAFGGEMKDVLVQATHICADGKAETFDAPKLELAYRSSIYCKRPDLFITQAVIRLKKGDAQKIKADMEEFKTKRRTNQPVEFPSAGSTFKRPQNGFAAAMIDQCGLKGTAVGGAMVSPKHAGFIVNTGGATCKDVLELVEIVRKKVQEQHGVLLECEIRLI